MIENLKQKKWLLNEERHRVGGFPGAAGEEIGLAAKRFRFKHLTKPTFSKANKMPKMAKKDK